MVRIRWLEDGAEVRPVQPWNVPADSTDLCLTYEDWQLPNAIDSVLVMVVV